MHMLANKVPHMKNDNFMQIKGHVLANYRLPNTIIKLPPVKKTLH